jgi:hypothetical protein
VSLLPLETLLTRNYTTGGVFNKESKQHSADPHSLGGFFSCFGVSVGKSNVQFSGSLDNSESLAGTNTVSDLTAVGSVLHEEQFHILLARNKQFLESVWESVSGLMILFATNSWHLLETSISSSGVAINTSDLSVGIGVDSLESGRLESSWSSRDFLHDLLPVEWLDCHYFIFNKE